MASVTSPDALGVLVLNATLIASVAAFPILLTGYAVSRARAREAEADASLLKLECIELDRAVLLYERVSERLKEIQQECSLAGAGVLTRYRERKKLRAQFCEEETDLRAYAGHLRSTIVGLRGRPIRRFRRWMHLASAEVAFMSCLMLYVSLFVSLAAVLSSDDAAWVQAAVEAAVQAATTNVQGFPWEPLDDHLFYANWLAATLASLSLPLLYVIRRARLLGRHRATLRELEAFAGADPDSLIPFRRADQQEQADQQEESAAWGAQSAPAPAPAADVPWPDVLGVSPSAGIDEVKTAYKQLIKQNHPDRVANMAPLFRELAEAETKRINAAYEEALLWAKAESAGTGSA